MTFDICPRGRRRCCCRCCYCCFQFSFSAYALTTLILSFVTLRGPAVAVFNHENLINDGCDSVWVDSSLVAETCPTVGDVVGSVVVVVDGLCQQSCRVSVRQAGALSADPDSQRL